MRLHTHRCDSADWGAFAHIWNAVVEDLRDTDLISDKERGHLSFHFFAERDQVGAIPCRCHPCIPSSSTSRVAQSAPLESPSAPCLAQYTSFRSVFDALPRCSAAGASQHSILLTLLL